VYIVCLSNAAYREMAGLNFQRCCGGRPTHFRWNPRDGLDRPA